MPDEPASNDDMAQSRTISLLNMKGGVGKTTLAVNLAWHVCRRAHKKVLLVDLDPQFNASQYLMNYDEWNTHRTDRGTIADLLVDPVGHRREMRLKKAKKRAKKSGESSEARATKRCLYCKEESTALGGRLDILPSELALAKAVKNPEGVPYRLEKALKTIRDRYDCIFVDCAPTDSVLTATALMASDYVLIPVRPDRYSVLGYAQIQEAFDEFRADYPDPHGVQDLGVVFNHVSGESSIEDECMADVAEKAEYVFETRIPVSRSYLRAAHERTPVFDTRYTRYVTIATIAALVQEIQDRIALLESEEEAE